MTRHPAPIRLVLALSIAVSALVGPIGCGAAQGGAGGGATPRHDRNVITHEELSDNSAQISNLYDLVQRLHPEWLAAHQGGSLGLPSSRSQQDPLAVQVYLDMQNLGNTDVLKQMSLTAASSLRFYPSSEAQMKFGNGNLNGAIQLISPNAR